MVAYTPELSSMSNFGILCDKGSRGLPGVFTLLPQSGCRDGSLACSRSLASGVSPCETNAGGPMGTPYLEFLDCPQTQLGIMYGGCS